MGGAVNLGAQVVSSAAEVAGKNKSERRYYRALAQAADKQAALTQAAFSRKAEYIFRSGAQEYNRLNEEYNQTRAAQKSAWAANGSGNSYTLQQMLQNSRWNYLTDRQTAKQNTADALYENNLAALLGTQTLQDEAAQYRSAARRSSGTFAKQFMQKMIGLFG